MVSFPITDQMGDRETLGPPAVASMDKQSTSVTLASEPTIIEGEPKPDEPGW